jgi:O-antigen/teichoic acid export membrane protein
LRLALKRFDDISSENECVDSTSPLVGESGATTALPTEGELLAEGQSAAPEKKKAVVPINVIRHAKRATLLIVSQATNLIGMVVLQALAKRTCGADVLGKLLFLIGIHTLLSLLSESGWGPTVAREIALAKSREGERDLVRAVVECLWRPVLIQLVLGAVIALLLARFRDPSYLVPGLLMALFSAGFPAVTTLRDLLQGQGNMRLLGVVYAGPSVIALLLAAGLALFHVIGLGTLCISYAFAMTAMTAFGFYKAGALAGKPGVALACLKKSRAEYGKRIWFGRLVSGAGVAIDTPTLGLFANPVAVAHYAIAKSMCNPMGVAFSLTVQPLFRAMAGRTRLPRLWQLATWVGAAIGVLGLIVVTPFVVNIIYRISTPEMRQLLMIQSVTAGCIGAYTLYNQFFAATGEGRILHFGGFAMGIVTATTNLILIPLYGARGACLAAMGTSLFWLCYCFIAYLRVAGRPKPKSGGPSDVNAEDVVSLTLG